MNLVFFSPYYLPYLSGITTYPQKLLKQLSTKHQIVVLTFNHANNLPSSEHMDGYHIQRLPYWFRLSKGFISPQSLIYFFNEVKKADVVLLNLPSVEGLTLAIMARIFHKPIVSIFHCMIYLPPQGFNRILNRLLRAIVIFQLNLSTKIITHTKDYYLSQNLQKFIHKTECIYPPVTVSIADMNYSRFLSDQKGSEIWVGFVGRVAQEKGLDNLIKAIQKLQKGQSSTSYRLVITGPSGQKVSGEAGYNQYIKKLLSASNIAYTHLGIISDHQLASFYKTIDVLVLPSINQTEAFGMVQVEAMLQGTPVIATNLPGVRMPIKETHMGILVKSKDIQALAKAILKLTSNTKVYATELIQVKEIFSPKKLLLNLTNTIEAVVEN